MRADNFEQLLGKLNTTYRDWPALKCEEQNRIRLMTYHELYKAVRERTAQVQKESSTCIGICGTSSAEWAIEMFASVCAGKRTVLLDPAAAADDLRGVVQATGMDAIWTNLPGIRKAFDNLMQDSELQTWQGQELHAYRETHGGDAIECGGKLLFFTSGTTERRKAVVLSQQALLSSAWNGQQMMHCTERDTVLSMIPLNHVFGFVCTFLWPLTQGAAVVFGRGLRYIKEDPVASHATILPVVPSLLRFLLKENALNKELKGLLVGAGPCDLESLRKVWMRGIDIRFGYGLTETASGLAISLRGENPFSMALCPDTKVHIGEDEQIYVQTTCMMDGYYHDPVHTAEKLTEKGLATGDIGYLDDKGHLHVRGRMDDVLVRSNGEKIFLREWEEDLAKMLQVEVVLLELDHKLTLVIQKEKDEELLQQTDEYNKRQPIGRKIEQVLFYPEPFPKTQTGKLQRWKLAELLAEKNVQEEPGKHT